MRPDRGADANLIAEWEREQIEGMLIAGMLESDAWKFFRPLIDLQVKILREKMSISDDPTLVFACQKRIDGIVSIIELADEIVSRGTLARDKMIDSAA